MRSIRLSGFEKAGAALLRVIEEMKRDAEPFDKAELAVRLRHQRLSDRDTLKAAERLIARLKRAGTVASQGRKWLFTGVEQRHPPTLRAYAVMDDEERDGDIVFAKDMPTALRDGARIMHGGDAYGLIVERVRWADRYAPGPVPFKAKFRHGWHQDCLHCGRTISDDAEYDDGSPVRFDIIERADGQVFCRPSCEAGFERWRSKMKRGRSACLKTAKSYVRKRLGRVDFLPDETAHVEFDHVGRNVIMRRVEVKFTVPGQSFGELTCRMQHDPADAMAPIRPKFFCGRDHAPSFTAYATGLQVVA